MDVKEVRRRNLLSLLMTAKKEYGLTRREFAIKCETDPSIISQITSQNQKINKTMGETVARRIERCLNLPFGWMDVPNWAQDDEASNLIKELQDATPPEVLDSVQKERRQIYANVYMRGSSMESSNPKKSIPDGAKLTVKTVLDESRISGKVVLVELDGHAEPTVKEIQIDGSLKYLVPWNDRYDVIRLTGDYKILGYVSEYSVSLVW